MPITPTLPCGAIPAGSLGFLVAFWKGVSPSGTSYFGLSPDGRGFLEPPLVTAGVVLSALCICFNATRLPAAENIAWNVTPSIVISPVCKYSAAAPVAISPVV